MMKDFLILVSIVALVLLIVAAGGFFVGIYIAIWGDNGFGGRVVATSLTTAFLSILVGLSAHQSAKECK